MLLFNAQNKTPTVNTLVLKPDASTGKDAEIRLHQDYINRNLGDTIHLQVAEWTRSGHPSHDAHSLIEFTGLKALNNVQIISATLVFHDGSSTSEFSSSYGNADNTVSIYRITENWDNNTVTSGNAPNYDTSISAEIPQNNDINALKIADVTQLVQIMVNDQNSSFGFYMKLKHASHYRAMSLISSNSPNQHEHPELTVVYEN